MPLILQQYYQRWRQHPILWIVSACLTIVLATLLLYQVVRMIVREGERYIPPAYLGGKGKEEGTTLIS
ncbi:hypothetical protein PG995_007420 [Apiospora arundinis]